MKKKIRIRTAHIVTALCLLVAGTLLYHLLTNISFEFGVEGQGTGLEFNIDNPAGTGFNRDVTVYTENGITRVDFSGKITVDGTAEIIVTANEDGSVVHSKSYSDLKSEAINFVIDNLNPCAYYILTFVSDNSKKGYLLLTTNESLVERPEQPARPEHNLPSHN